MATDFNVRISATVDLSQAKAQMQAFMNTYNKLVIGGSAAPGGGTTGGKGGTTTVFTETGKAAKSSATMIGSFTSELKNLKNTIPKVAAFSVATGAISAFTTAVKDSVGAVVEMDKALTEFKRVSTLSGVGLDAYAKKASELGGTVARTGAQMVNAATEFRRSGFGDYDSLELAKVAAMFQNVADSEMSAGDAAGFIVSQMKAFDISASNSQHIIDAVYVELAA